jgi:hypothetical protein
MKKDDLSLLKHIGVSRMNLLNSVGINTIEQLHETSLEKLSQIKSIGEHYSKLIKESAAEYYKNRSKLPEKTLSAKDMKPGKVKKGFQKKIARLDKRLNQANEDLKPLWKKKYLEQYIDFKKKSKKLKARLNTAGQMEEDLPKKAKKSIVKKAEALNSVLKKAGKKPKKKTYREITREIQSFSTMLRDMI